MNDGWDDLSIGREGSLLANLVLGLDKIAR